MYIYLYIPTHRHPISMLDADTSSVVLSFCDLHTTLQLSRVCKAHHDDVRKHLRQWQSTLNYIKTAFQTRETDNTIIDLIEKHCNEPDWCYQLIRAWVNSVQSTVSSCNILLCPSTFEPDTNWLIPQDSHLRKHSCRVLCTHKLPYKLVAAPLEWPHQHFSRLKLVTEARCKRFHRLADTCSRNPFIIYTLCRIGVFVLECHVWQWFVTS